VCPKQVKRTEGGYHYRIRVPGGWIRPGTGGSPGTPPFPPKSSGSCTGTRLRGGSASDEPLVTLSESGVRNVVKWTAERAAEEAGDEGFRHVSSHDLRRRFAQRLLVDEQLNPRVVIQVGGWESF
jgi:integrase